MKRAKFDFSITFTNGGGLNGQDFRLDIEEDTISDEALAAYIIKDLNLLMVGETKIFNKEIINEAHKRISPKTILIDLSHTIEDGLITYKGLPAPIVCDFLSREDSKANYEEGTQFQIGKIEMVTNTGTYLDCPFHRYADGKDLSEFGLEAFTDLEAICVTITDQEITPTHFKGLTIKDKAVLINTGWSTHWNTENYFENHPFVNEEAATYLKDAGAKLVGIDSHNIDDTRTNKRPAHTILLGAEILIVEHMCNLNLLPQENFTFSAIPPKFKGVGTFPVRAHAKISQ